MKQIPQTDTSLIYPLMQQPIIADARPTVRGKFIFVGERKFYIRGVTYGTFRPGPQDDGSGYPDPQIIEQDFARMAASGVNVVRTYTVPPSWVLDAAQWHGLYVM